VLEYLRSRIGERSTNLGLIALLLGTIMLAAAFFAPPERYPNVESAIQWIGQLFMVGGLTGVLLPDKRKP
jgi:hypothetical protein